MNITPSFCSLCCVIAACTTAFNQGITSCTQSAGLVPPVIVLNPVKVGQDSVQ